MNKAKDCPTSEQMLNSSVKMGIGGRPSNFADDLAKEICFHVASGLSLRKIERIEGMPSMRTIMDWLDENTEFAQHYARAKDVALQAIAEEIIEIGDNENEDPNSRRVRIDARKWILAKLLPKKYGDSVSTPVVNVGVAVNNTLSEERRADLVRKKRDATLRLREAKRLASLEVPSEANGGN